MRCERFPTAFVLAIVFAACGRETPAPPTPAAPPAPAAQPARPVPQQAGASYKDAMLWLKSAPAFHFVLDDHGVHAEGDLQRRTVGLESVQFTASGTEWRASSGPRGVTWEKRSAGKWTAAATPEWGNRIYQRLTLALDPQKKEGDAQMVGSEGTAKHYRFTNVNTGEVHDVWVGMNGQVERMTVGSSVDLRIGVR
jgi:hypothetical protein